MIIFGHNNFKIKSFSPEEAGLPASEDNNFTFEVRQKYFHLFWIPFFPIGKVWILKKVGDEESYTIPAHIEVKVKKNVSVGTPWYSFALVFIGIFVGLMFTLSQAQSAQNREDYFYNSVAESKMLIQYPTTGDFYKFTRYESQDGYSSGTIILKVMQYDKDKIQFNSLEENFYAETRSFGRRERQEHYLDYETNNYNPTYIDKEILTSLLRQDYNDYSSKRLKIPNLDGFYTLKEINRMNLE